MKAARPRRRVLYFTCLDLGPVTDGGALCCRNHIEILARDPGVELYVAVVGRGEIEAANRSFVQSLGLPFHFIHRDRSDPDRHVPWPDPELRHLFHWEAFSITAAHAPAQLASICAGIAPDCLFIDCVPSALYARPLLESGFPFLIVTFADESRFFRDLQRHSPNPEYAGSELAVARLKVFESWVFARARRVVAFRAADIAHSVRRPEKRLVIPPVFPPLEQRWQGPGAKTAFFVGNRDHFPNRQAIDWLCGQLAPVLAQRDPEARIRIVGASPGEVEQCPANVDLLGRADRATVLYELATCGLFVAPITLEYGSEIKLQECLAAGTPLVATRSGLEGLVPLPFVPEIELRDPDAAAGLIAELLQSPARLRKLGARMAAAHLAEISRQETLWGSTIEAMLAEDASA